MEIAAVYSENACVIGQVALDINNTAKGNECLELLKGSKGLETVLELWNLPGETELSKYLSITYFILYILFIIWFYIPPTCANTSEWLAGSRAWCLGKLCWLSVRYYCRTASYVGYPSGTLYLLNYIQKSPDQGI